jgi:tRNA modification GTPase
VAILGRPNAGKSSLLNAIARRDVAIVTDEAGTTRDVLEVALDLSGYPVLLFDTAGLREAVSPAEREGVRRAKAAGESADLILWLEDCSQGGEAPPELGAPVWRVSTKVDLAHGGEHDLAVSAKTGEGLAGLVQRLEREAAGRLGTAPALITRQRQREAVEEAVDALDRVSGAPDEIAADLLRAASEAIGRLTGRIGVEHVLDRLFSEFCIGK